MTQTDGIAPPLPPDRASPPRLAAGDRFLLAIWLTLAIVVARTALQVLVDYSSEKLRGNLLFEHALEHTTFTSQKVWILLMILTLLVPGRATWSRILRAATVAIGALYFVAGLQPGDEPQYRPGYESVRGVVGWLMVLLFAGALVRIDAWISGPRRRLLRGVPTTRFSITAVLLLVGGGAVLAMSKFVEAERRFIVLEGTAQDGDLLGRFRDHLEVEVEGSVEIGTIAPQAGYAERGGSRESLVLRPGSAVTYLLRPRGNSDLVFSYGADLDSVRAVEQLHSGLEPELRVRVQIDGESVFSQTFQPVDDETDRRWFDARIALEDTGGQPVAVRLSLESTDVGARLLRAAIAEPAIHRTERVARLTTSSDRWNVVLINVDSLRADRLASYGAKVSRMPFVDESLVPQSILYERAIAQSSWVWPSVATLFTGLAPLAHGVVDEVQCFLPDPVLTLAERLRFRGITTGGWTANPLISHDKNFDQGFTVWREFAQKDDHLIAHEFEDFLVRYRDFQFFTYLHLAATRAPYRPSNRFLEEVMGEKADRAVNRDFDERALVLARGDASASPDAEELRQLEGLYDASVLTVDSTLAALWDVLWRLHLLDRTVVILTSPNGEEFLEHGLLQHGWSLYQDAIRVPLIVRCPWIHEAQRIAEPVELGGLAGTILGWVGLLDRYRPSSPGLPPFHNNTGLALAFSCTQRKIPGVPIAPQWVSVQSDRHKLIRDLLGGTAEVFDLKYDPEELRPLPPTHTAEIEFLDARLQKWLETQNLQRERLGAESMAIPIPGFSGESAKEESEIQKN